MLPGISALDCLFADLGIDQSTTSLQSIGATDLLLRHRQIQTDSHVILWQIGFIGNATIVFGKSTNPYLPVLVDYLLRYYPPEHELTIYEAPQYAIAAARKEKIPLRNLASAQLTSGSTLYIPPATKTEVDRDIASRLGFDVLERRPEIVAASFNASSSDQPSWSDRSQLGSRSSLADLTSALAENPCLLAEFNRNTHKVAERYHLTQEELNAALTRSSMSIHRAIAETRGGMTPAGQNAREAEIQPGVESAGAVSLRDALPPFPDHEKS